MRLAFARHGESHANLERVLSNRSLPHGLTERGREQARALARRLEGVTLLAVHASPIPRARETAGLVAGPRGLSVQTADALREFDCGVFEGRGDPEAWRAHDAVVRAWDGGDPDARLEGGESFNELRGRFAPFVAGVVAEHEGRDGVALLVSHGSLLGLMLPLILANAGRDLARRHPLGPGEVVVAEPRGGALVCLRWPVPNDHPWS